MRTSHRRLCGARRSALLFTTVLLGAAVAASGAQAARWVVTFHYDNNRTGWNRVETKLTPSTVAGGQFGLLHAVALDEQVDAQPLLAGSLAIHGKVHQVLFVATENNTVYALDATTGATLLSRNLGPPVPKSAVPFGCPNNSAVIGIQSTPVIDQAASTLYVMAYTYVNSKPVWSLYALDLATLSDKAGPAVVQASAKLNDGSVFGFNAALSRQRTALLEANGNIYAGFGSFCDGPASAVRGWVLGWQAGSLAPLPTNYLTDKLAKSAQNFFLTSVWMSGSGIAAGSMGRLYFTTGNSDPSGTSYSAKTNLANSVVKLSPDLTTVEGFFTPSDPAYGTKVLDRYDVDFGSGGVMLLPAQPGVSTGLLVAAGKAGQMYLMSRSSLGGHTSNGINRVLGTYTIGPCWCSEAYFTGADGVGRVVSSGGPIVAGSLFDGGDGGGQIMIWKLQTSPQPALALESQSPTQSSGQDGGFFTTVSSNGSQNPIVWTVGRPHGNPDLHLTLYAYDPVAAASGPANWLFSENAATWPNLGSNADVVPVVANGRVFVAGYKELDIFGLGAGTAVQQAARRLPLPAAPPRPPLAPGEHEIYGKVEALGAGTLRLATRAGAVEVASRAAIDAGRSVPLAAGKTVRVTGAWDGAHLLHATSIVKVKPSLRIWPADR